MARYVRLTVVYDMDDTEKAIGEELKDWIEGHIAIADLGSQEYELVEISQEQAEEWLGVKAE